MRRKNLLVGGMCVLLGVFLARLPDSIAAVRQHVVPAARALALSFSGGSRALASSGGEGAGGGGRAGANGEPVDWPAALAEVNDLVLKHYVTKPDEEALLKGAIRGLTDSLDDPYTEFIPPADRVAFEKEITGQFVGIGASVSVLDGWLTVAYPLEDSPAYRAGVLPGDRIIRVGETSTKGMTVDDGVKLLLGEPGTKVSITVQRGGKPDQGPAEEIELPITRAQIVARSVKGFRWLGGEVGGGGGARAAGAGGNAARGSWDYSIDAQRGIVYCRMTQFTPTCAAELKQTLRATSPRGLILDLRDNPGGLMDQAIQIVDLFVDSGVVLSTRGRPGSGDEQVYRAKRGSPFPDMPVAVLVNQASASASEIVAGALQDNKRATVIGTRSFGKGLVQRIEQLDSVPGAQLKITEQHYYLPSGRLIQRTDDSPVWGVDPSQGFYVPVEDDQILPLARLRREMETVRPATSNVQWAALEAPRAPLYAADATWSDPEWLGRTLGDVQLAAALRAMQGRIDSGEWTPSGAPLPDQVKRIAASELTRLDRLRERVLRELARIDRRIEAFEDGTDPKPRAERIASLWPDEIDMVGGRIDVYDKSGKRVAALDVVGPDVERWLLDAQVRPHGEPVGENAQSAAPSALTPAPMPGEVSREPRR